MIEIDERQLDGKPKKVGTLHGKPVLLFRTKGGFYMNVIMKNGARSGLGPDLTRLFAVTSASSVNPKWAGPSCRSLIGSTQRILPK